MTRKLYSLLLFLVCSLSARATHMSGGEIYWECIGPNQYRITLVVYRDCAGINVQNSAQLDIVSPCGHHTLTVNTPGGVELSQLCDLQLPNSTCNGGSLPGIQQYVYTGTITLPPCDSWTISWTNNWRNNAIMNLTTPGAQPMYIEGVMNNSIAPCNDSPTFTSLAVPYVCLGYPVSYSYGTVDAEGDSLSYQLISARNASGSLIPYVPPYTPLQPITGLTLDPVTGLLNFTCNLAGNWVVVIQVNEYDANGNLIGTIMRDMQFVVYPCTNIPPDPTTGTVGTLTGNAVQTAPYAVEVCESGNFCFDAVITDANPSNVLEATTNITSNLPGATFSYTGTNPITCHICWTATPGSQGFYPFIVTVNDGACPIVAYQTYVYTVHVLNGVHITTLSTDESCTGVGDGSVAVTVLDGIAPYQYAWTNGSTAPIQNVGAGTYGITVTDAQGCTSAPASETVIAPSPPTANAGTDLIACYGTWPIALQGTSTNASSSVWSNGTGTFSGTFPNVHYTPSAAEIANGGVDLILTANSASACPPASDMVHIAISNSFINSSVSAVNATCNGGTNGSASFTPNSPLLTYHWNTTPVQTTATANNLGAGTYTVLVTDQLNCTTTLSTSVTAPATITIPNVQVTSETCAGNGDGTITVSVSGGTPPYYYNWSNGYNTSSITVGAGTYVVAVTDANGCAPATATATVTATNQPNVANAGPDVIGCQGALPVALQGSVVNATSGAWSGGAGGFTGSGLNVQYMPSNAEVINGGVDLYFTTVGNVACPPDMDTVHVSLSNSFLNATISEIDATCNGAANGSASFSPNSPLLSYQWNSIPVQTTATANNLGAGNYSVLVTDQLSCTTTLNTTVNQPAAITLANVQVTNETCAGNGDGTITVNVNGGTAPYYYNWSNGYNTSSITVGAGTYVVAVTDANGCAPATATATVTATNQPNVANAGPDVIGCQGALPVALQGSVVNATSGAWSGGAGGFTGSGLNVQYMPSNAEVINGGVDLYFTTVGNVACPPDMDTVHVSLSNSFLNATISEIDATCNGAANGSASFSPNSPLLSYQWNSTPVQTTATASNLGAGNYSVLVTDQLNCTTTLNTTVNEPAAITIANVQVTNETCAGSGNGTITVTASGGTLPYSYNWSNGGSSSSITVAAGTYVVSITDANGCSPATTSATVIAISQPNIANAGADQIACPGSYPIALQGSVLNAASGMWSGGSGSFSSTGLNPQYTPAASEVAMGWVDLILTTTGNTNCPADADTVHVTLPNDLLNASVSANGATCAGGTNGTAIFQPSSPAFTYLWSDPAAQTTPTASGLASGTYSVHVTDPFGCDTTLSVLITQPPALAITSVQAVDPTCSNGTNGTATAAVAGGTPGYNYQWSANAGGQITSTANNLGDGTFIIVVTDANGCTTQASATLASPAPVTLSAQAPDTVCVNAPVQLTAQAGGGIGNYTITWSGIGYGTALTYSFPFSQIVNVSVTDGAGCSGPSISLPVYVLDLSLATLTAFGDTIACPGGSAHISAIVNNYPGAVTLTWPLLGFTGIGPFTVPITADQTFTVIATDVCGNTLSDDINVTLDVPPVITLPPMIAEGCEPLVVTMPDSLTNQTVSYVWNFGDGSSSTEVAPSHTYMAGSYSVSLVVTTAAGCSAPANNTGQVIAHPAPHAEFTADQWSTTFATPTFNFTNQSVPSMNIHTWDFGDGGTSTASNPAHTYGDIGVFEVQLAVQNSFGCRDTVVHTVELTPVYDITIPNAFSPNPNGGNGGGYDPTDLSNDVFYPFVRFVKDFNMRVWNRWGELVFESNDIRRGWDGYYRGQLSQQDVYVYRMQVRFVDDREVERMGDLTLFR